ncbi:MAG: hypothetical protein K2H02_04065, partial [Anaeroplasmataceae bacterium]|nr:hypothetical protein [Anaeroplasmataceae bacterium]
TFMVCRFNVSAATYDFYATARAYGFNVSEDFAPYLMEGSKLDDNGNYIKEHIRSYQYIKKVKDKIENVTTIYDMILFNKADPSIKCYAYKVISCPYQPGRYWGFLGIGSYGDDFYQDYVKVSIQFPENHEIMSYAPVNSPSRNTTTIGVSVGTSGFNVSASASFDHSDLEVISHTKTNEAYYEALYEFDQSSESEYIKNEVVSYGMVMYKAKGVPDFKADYEVRYHDRGGWESGLELTKETLKVRLSY